MANYVSKTSYLAAESRLNRKQTIKDERIHACLYFLPPRVHGLRQIDIEFMINLHDKVILIPIISKGDTLTTSEKVKMKANIRKQMKENNITVYYFSADGELELDCNSESSNMQPYSVVGSNYIRSDVIYLSTLH